MGVLYECPCVICSRYPSGGRYVSRATFYRHGGSNMALSRAKRRRTDARLRTKNQAHWIQAMTVASRRRPATALMPPAEMNKTRRMAACSTVLAVAPSVHGLWTGAGQAVAEVATEVSSPTAVMMASGWWRRIYPWTCCRTTRFLMAATTTKQAKTLKTLGFFFSRRFSPWMTCSTGLPTMSTSGSPRRLLFPLTGWPCRQRPSLTWSKTLWRSASRKSTTYLEKRWPPC